jgi:hypothetical protein
MGRYQFYVNIEKKIYIININETDNFDKTIDMIIQKMGGNIDKEILLNNFDFYCGRTKLLYDDINNKYIIDIILPNENLLIKVKKNMHQNFDHVGYNIMRKLIEHLILSFIHNNYDKIIISKFSYNIELNNNVANIKKNIIQQFQYMNIDDNLQNICIVLYDKIFFESFEYPQNQFYELINVNEIELDGFDNKSKNMRIKKFIKERNNDFEESRLLYNSAENKGHSYGTLYVNTLRELIGDKFKNKNITWFVVKCLEENDFVNTIIKDICKKININPNTIFKVCFFNGDCEVI